LGNKPGFFGGYFIFAVGKDFFLAAALGRGALYVFSQFGARFGRMAFFWALFDIQLCSLNAVKFRQSKIQPKSNSNLGTGKINKYLICDSIMFYN
jgi:hypothetical protein